jgi:hypothetical protein
VEHADPHTSVTFVSVASSGASIEDGLVGAQQSTGLPAQIDQVKSIVGNRKIDALLMSVGGNDVDFQGIVEALMNPLDTYASIGANFNASLDQLAANFNDLAAALGKLNVNMSDVYLSEYADPVSGSPDGILADAASSFFPGLGTFVSLTREEMDWAEQNVLAPLDGLLSDAASNFGWNFVDGINSAFQGHGYDTSDSYIVTYQESLDAQGADSSGIPEGMLHPNAQGQAVIASVLEAEIMPHLVPNAAGATAAR